MRKVIKFFYLLIVLGIVQASPASLEAKEIRKPLKVVCTFLPIYSLTLNVVEGISGIQVELLLPVHQGCPHNYDLTPGDLLKMARADLIIANGLGMEEFLDQFLLKTNNKVPILRAAEKIQPVSNLPVLSRLGGGKKNRDSGRAQEESLNGHAWVSPKAAAVMVRTIAEGLASKAPDQAAGFRANADRYARKLEDLSGQMSRLVSLAKNKKVLAFHDDLPYLARDIGLHIIGVVEVRPGIEPTTKELARLVSLIRSKQPAALFSEPQYSDKVVRTLSRETGIPFFELDPVAAGRAAGDTYEKAMKKNLDILRKALR
jgi:ABC-type Zn uptake system ZnuABC Zn-binding protein ZnuA